MASISFVGSPTRPLPSSVGKYSIPVSGFVLNFSSMPQRRRRPQSLPLPEAEKFSDSGAGDGSNLIERRSIVLSSIGMVAVALCNASKDGVSLASQFADMPAIRGKDYGKSKMSYPDYTETQSGLQYKDLRVGSGPKPKMGDTVLVDWDGYTIGYYGRIFEARNKTKGGSFEGDDKAFFKFRVGSEEVIPAFEEATSGMALGGIRRAKEPWIMC